MTPVLGIIASSNQQGRSSAVGSYDALATITVPSGGLASVVFAGIPIGYRHLELRTFVQQASTGGYVEVILGNATFSRRHWVFGSGSSSAVASSDTTNAPGVFSSAFSSGNSVFASSVFEILDYASTKNKTTRTLGGTDNNGSGSIYLMSGLYLSTTPVTSITLNAISQNFTQYSTFALYGVK